MMLHAQNRLKTLPVGVRGRKHSFVKVLASAGTIIGTIVGALE